MTNWTEQSTSIFFCRIQEFTEYVYVLRYKTVTDTVKVVQEKEKYVA